MRVWTTFRRLFTKKVLFTFFVLLLIYVIFLRGGTDSSKIKTVTVKRGEIASEVSAAGNIRATNESDLKFAVSGKVVSVPVSEGDNVKKGQIIALLDREKYEIAVRQANQDVIAADAELAKVYDGVKKDNFETFEERITRTAAEAKKNKAYDNWKAAQRDLRDTVLISPISGTITSLNIKPLQDVLITTDVGKVIDTTGGLQFYGEVDETEISKINFGQNAKITLDAFEGEDLDSNVFSIADQSLTTSTGATAYLVKFNIPFDSKYKVGMNGEVRIATAKSENTLFLPFDALIDDKYVWVKKEGVFQKVEVEKGLESDLYFEIVKGVKEGDEVVSAGFSELGKQSLLQKILRKK